MPYEVYLEHLDRNGSRINPVVAPLWERWTNSIDNDEPLVFALEDGNTFANSFTEYDILLVKLRNKELGIQDASGGFITDFVGLFRDTDRDVDDDGIEVVTFNCPNEKHILRWRYVLWPSGTANRSTFTNVAAETVMKNLVLYNATSLATVANGRWDEGDLATGMGITITVALDQVRGNIISGSYSGDNLLEALQEIRRVAGGDFSFTRQSAATWLFEFHLGQLGEDKSTGSNQVTFSNELPLDNMRNPSLRQIRSTSATRALVAGQGQAADRLVSSVNGASHAANNDIELFVDARDEATAGGRITRGQVKLDQRRPLEVLDFGVIQTQDTFYSRAAVTGRKTYREGDKVLAVFGGERARIVERVGVAVSVPGNQDSVQIFVDTEDV